jgi:hypothetical protein
MIRKELKDTFLRELTSSEKGQFLKRAKEAILAKGYRPSEDLFYYCYFKTMKERVKTVYPMRGDGMLRLLLVEGAKDIDEMLSIYVDRLEETKGTMPDPRGDMFIEYLSE